MKLYNKGSNPFHIKIDNTFYKVDPNTKVDIGNTDEETLRRRLKNVDDVLLVEADQMFFKEWDLNNNGIFDQVENNSLGFSMYGLDELIFNDVYPDPTHILNDTNSGSDLQDLVNSAPAMSIIRIDTNNVFTPVVMPANKPMMIYALPQYQPIIDGQNSSPYCIVLKDGCEGLYFGNLKLINQSGSNTSGAIDNAGGFCLESPALVKNIILKQLEVYNCTEAGIQFQTQQSVTQSPSSLEDLSRGIYIINCFTHTCSTNDNTENGGITLYDCRDYMIIGCWSTDNLRGIIAPNSIDGYIQGNVCWNNRDAGIKLDSVPGLSFPQAVAVIIDNVSYDNGNEGIRLDDASRAYVINNTVVGNTHEGIMVEDLSNESYIMNNLCLENEYGIRIEDDLTDAIAIYNNCYNNTTADYDLGTNVINSLSNMSINVDNDFVDKANHNYTLLTKSLMNRAGYRLLPIGSSYTDTSKMINVKNAISLTNTKLVLIYNDFKGLKRLDTEAGEILYTPANTADWNTIPDKIKPALDELASRVKALEP